MFQDETLLIVGGTARNVGKTEFICRVIGKISSHHTVVALKVSAIFPDEGIYHGDHSGEQENQCLFEETRFDTAKDTSRMLKAGAERVFYLRSEDSGIFEAFTQFRRQLPAGTAIVCESNSLAEHVKPSLLVVVKKKEGTIKPRAEARLKQADLVVASDGSSGFIEVDHIHYNSTKHWHIIY